MGLDDFAPATETGIGADPLDEDLFDFPAMEMPEPPVAEIAPEEATEAAADCVDVFDEGTGPAAAASGSKICTGLDPKLDEDLFGFPPMDLSSLGIAAPGEASADIEQSIDQASQTVADLLDDDLGDIVQEAHTQTTPVGTVPAPAPVEVAAPVRAPANAVPAPAVAPVAAVATAPVALSAIAVPSASPKALWVLTAAIIMFMVGLLGIAWRATSSFQQEIQAVRQNVQSSAEQLQATTTGSIRELAELERELLRNQVAAAKVDRDVHSPQSGLSIAAPHEVVLEVANEALEKGRYIEARRMLFNLLAEADSHPSTIRSDMERDALFMIAKSHKLEAEVLPGETE